MNLTVKDKILISTFAALTAIGAFIRIPVPYVPFTMQFFFCSISAIILGAKKGALSQLLYVLIGLIGIPVFTRGGGPQYIFQPTFGYLIGLILSSYIIGKVISKKKNSFKNVFLANIIGVIVIYLIGVPYFYFINKYYLGANISISFAIYYGFLLTIPGDIVKVLITSLVGVRLTSSLNHEIVA
ncbi:Biotin transporter BioY [bioreactor metagenome]|uniref:Biotin transporter n=2 Tax=root TaxID=1 RepID=R9CGG6_9CLOT|nr:biotin transporter BioY [Clostridium sartagoforme]EOR26301.1 biotin synthase [Clostridium sartagoforme AAU1]